MITRKIKIGKHFYSCFRLIQNITHPLQPFKLLFFFGFWKCVSHITDFLQNPKKTCFVFFLDFFFLKYRHSTEKKIEPISWFFRSLFFELWPFLCYFYEIFMKKMSIFEEKKNRKVFLFTPSFDSEHCAPYPIKKRGGHFWGGGGLHVLKWEKAFIF